MGKVIVHNKLVRDNIPQIIANGGGRAKLHQMDNEEYRHELLKKLIEEANELLESDGSIEERADVAEVLKAIDELMEYDAQELEQVRIDKAQERGEFKQRLFLEKVTK